MKILSSSITKGKNRLLLKSPVDYMGELGESETEANIHNILFV